MKNKFKIILDILFRNAKYLKATNDLYVKDFIIKQEPVKPLIFIGRYLVSKPESENIPEDIIYKCAFKNLMESTDLMQHLHKEKTELKDNDHFFHEYPKIAYEVQLTIVPKQETQS